MIDHQYPKVPVKLEQGTALDSLIEIDSTAIL